MNIILANKSVSKKWLASQLNVSPAQIRVLMQVYRAFPEKQSRMPEMNWYHHRVAANSLDPDYYIREAAAKGLSTREMQDLISDNEKKSTVQRKTVRATKKKKLRKLESAIAEGIQGQLRVLSGKGLI
ncbi:hypothetical protein [Lentibacillus salinarum]|uniref:hypothetical protein n=1 Tax=Lentibacillus salinarum TaxID=446820 RepID=UPI0036D28F60